MQRHELEEMVFGLLCEVYQVDPTKANLSSETVDSSGVNTGTDRR